MKQLAAFLLMSLMLFNWYGYRLVSSFLEQQADQRLETQILQHTFNKNDLLEFKVPLNLPYQVISQQYTSASGEIVVAGIVYKYVKRRIINDSMSVLCLPNIEKTQLDKSKNQFTGQTAAAENNAHGKARAPKASLKMLVFDAVLTNLQFQGENTTKTARKVAIPLQYLLRPGNIQAPSIPPETWSVS